ncbi:uncharacterized protein LOC118796910 [Colossoma macropomum]|uniref:uncharacterized protein LOC118796910 n=1 Tax=Colossoma macropomum TaxID=42526 RepID=UPI0018654B9E|nr:uncharacterized protein LOC118796910 [Colossoma macropomum]
MERDGGSRAEGNGEMEHTHLHLTCLPERYMRAKFSLSAYIFCWAVVKLCQGRLRPSPVLTQAPPVEDVAAEAGCSEDGESQQEENTDRREWTEPALEESQDTTEDYFETRSCYSDTFSDFSHDVDDCFRTPLSSEAGSVAGAHLDSPKHYFGFRERLPSCAERHLATSDGLQWETNGKHPRPEPRVTEKSDTVPLASECGGMTLDVPGRDEAADCSLTDSFGEAGLPPDAEASVADPATVCFASNDSQLFTEPVSKSPLPKTLTDENEAELLSGNGFELAGIKRNEKESQYVSDNESDTETELISESSKEVTCSEKPESLQQRELNHPDSETCLQEPQLDVTDTHVVEYLEQFEEAGVEISVVDSKLFAKSECNQEENVDSCFPHSVSEDTSEHGHLQQVSDQPCKDYNLLRSSDSSTFRPEDPPPFQKDNEQFCRGCDGDGLNYNEERFSEAPDSDHCSIEGGPSSLYSDNCVLSHLPVSEHILDKIDTHCTDHSEILSEKDAVLDVHCTHSHLQDGALDCTEPNLKVSEQNFSNKAQSHREEKVIVGPNSITFKSTDTEERNSLSPILRTPAGSDISKMSSDATPHPKTCSVKEFTIIPQKEQEVIYSDNSDYGDSHVMLSKEVESVSFGCAVDSRVDRPPGLFESVSQESVTAPVSPTDVCFEFRDDLPANCTQITSCDLANLSDVDEVVKKIPVYPKQCPSNLSAKQFVEEDLTKSHERAQAEHKRYDHSFSEKDGYCEDNDAFTILANTPSSFLKTSESVTLTDNENDIVSTLNLEAGNSSGSGDSAQEHISDYLVGKECQLHFSAMASTVNMRRFLASLKSQNVHVTFLLTDLNIQRFSERKASCL